MNLGYFRENLKIFKAQQWFFRVFSKFQQWVGVWWVKPKLYATSVIDFYYIYTQTVIFFKSRVKHKLMSNIETWINAPDYLFVGEIITQSNPKYKPLNQNISPSPSIIIYDCQDRLSDVY